MDQAPATQAGLEARLHALSAQQPPADATVTDVYGPFESWTCRVGQRSLFLDPLSRRWYYHDPNHDAWEPTGFGPGEVEFGVEGPRIGYRRLPPPLDACPDCGRRLSPGSRFCPKCGLRFGQVALRCTSCQHDNRPTAGFCTNCGRPLHQHAVGGERR